MPVVPFIPLIASGVSAGVGYLANRGKNKALENSANAQGAATTMLANQQAQMGADQYQMGRPLLQQASGYYSKILSGNRSAMQSALQPEREATTDIYRGAERSLDRSGIQGGSRDVARAELSRNRAGQLSSLLSNMRPQAAAQTSALGGGLTSSAMGATQNAASVYQNLLAGTRSNQQYQNSQQAASGAAWGKLLADLGQTYADKYSNKGAGYGAYGATGRAPWE